MGRGLRPTKDVLYQLSYVGIASTYIDGTADDITEFFVDEILGYNEAAKRLHHTFQRILVEHLRCD